MQVLVVDVGGTKTRVAGVAIAASGYQIEHERDLPSSKYSSLEAVLEGYLTGVSSSYDAAAIGIAGPVRDGVSQATNLPWTVQAKSLQRALKLDQVSLLNDLEANAWGIGVLPASDIATIYHGATDATGNASLIAAGTGLGEAGLYWDGKRYQPFASEGGHTEFAPSNDLDIELLQYLQQRYHHVSWERVVSGPGLENVYRFLVEFRGYDVPSWLNEAMQTGDPAAEISKAATEQTDPLSIEAMEHFVRLYGAEAGNHALKLMATGGVFLGGGIAPKIHHFIKQGGFLASFFNKGRMEDLMRAIPVRVILNDRAALLGLAAYAENLSTASTRG